MGFGFGFDDILSDVSGFELDGGYGGISPEEAARGDSPDSPTSSGDAEWFDGGISPEEAARGDAARELLSAPNAGGDNTSSAANQALKWLEKNPRLATGLLGMAAGGMSGLQRQKEFEQTLAFKKAEMDRMYDEKHKSLEPGVLKRENWGGLIATARK